MERGGIFAGADPFALAQAWLDEATPQEPNDPNAIALATVDDRGLPDVRMVLLKEIEQREGDRDGAFLFYTNYQSAKGHEIEKNGEALDPLKPGKAAFVLHWKSLRRQVRVRGLVTREEGPKSDAYYRSRDIGSRYGAWASQQSRPLSSREALMADVAKVTLREGLSPKRPPFWGGYRIRPLQIEFWANGTFRLHDRFIWTRPSLDAPWSIERQHP